MVNLQATSLPCGVAAFLKETKYPINETNETKMIIYFYYPDGSYRVLRPVAPINIGIIESLAHDFKCERYRVEHIKIK